MIRALVYTLIATRWLRLAENIEKGGINTLIKRREWEYAMSKAKALLDAADALLPKEV